MFAANSSIMHTIDNLQAKINQAISVLPLNREPKNLYDPMRYLLSIGGKRIRPLLTLMAADLFDAARVDDALHAAMAIELFHNFTLAHDDIMDKAPLRRGNPTLHEKWDVNTAILSGDNLMILAYAQLVKCTRNYVPDLLCIFNQMATEVCEGQQLDMDFEKEERVEMETYLRMIQLKTSVLLGAALQLGAIIAGAGEQQARELYSFGVNVGIAFQLQDDILDTFGNPEAFGKQAGGDILANKKTCLLIKAQELAVGDIKRELDFLLSSSGNKDGQKVKNVTRIYEQLDVLKFVTQLKNDYVKKAFDYLENVNVTAANKTALMSLATDLLNRKY